MTALPRPDRIKDVHLYVEAWENTRTRALELFQRVDDATFKAPPPEGGWSASQIAEHLYLTQISFALSIPAVFAGKFGYDAANMAPRN
ncbi:MAG: DinB family protein [Spirochaetia bacterium]|nr:DinB family protein [Spirochaetia bacterium]